MADTILTHMPTEYSRVWIENVRPAINSGVFPIKRTVGELVRVSADIFTDGYDQLSASVFYRRASVEIWEEAALVRGDNDSWSATFLVEHEENYFYRVGAWIDTWSGWCFATKKKLDAGQDVTNDLLEGGDYLKLCLKNGNSCADLHQLEELAEQLISLVEPRLVVEKALLLREQVVQIQPRRQYVQFPKTFIVQVDRLRARFSSWYELFPRSTSNDAMRSGTFRDATQRLDYVADLGFDVIYLPPIHPIGETKRKGKNNSLVAQNDDVGSPWAIGNKNGGHKEIEPALGTLDEFRTFVREANARGIEIALDLAFQCSPDHPYVQSHPEWFKQRPDGTIHYAENPPKKYEDIYPFNFESEDWRGLWNELKSVVLHWVQCGVKIFRVDNPHTKPFRFWEWLIAEVQKVDRGVLFLSEAFTRPKVMYALAKLGFHQSYTYFTWRNSKPELTEYVGELTTSEVGEYFRPNFFANTPDILHHFLQTGGRPAFMIRAVLASTLSSNYGIYSGFELCEGAGVPGSEEYLDSEKYQLKVRDWNASTGIHDLIRRLNAIRREFHAFQLTNNVRFCGSTDPNIIAYLKKGGGAQFLVIVNVDPFATHEGMVSIPRELLHQGHAQQFEVEDLLSGNRYVWHGEQNYVRLDPQHTPAHVFRLVGDLG